MPSSKNENIRLRAYAKINLSLKVISKRPDGYHDIDSIMQSVSLHDEIEIKTAPQGIRVRCIPDIAPNIAEKAAKTVLEGLKQAKGIDINIIKRIPLAAGLAGGSADAAAVITGIDRMYGLNLHRARLMELGAKVGADVPFCLTGGTCRVTGIGDKVEKVNPKSGGVFILVFPKIEVSTKEVYDAYDKFGPGNSGNDLESAAISVAPEIKKIKGRLVKSTGGDWRMSGSGPTLFLELSDLSEAEDHIGKIAELDLAHQLVRRMDKGVEVIN